MDRAPTLPHLAAPPTQRSGESENWRSVAPPVRRVLPGDSIPSVTIPPGITLGELERIAIRQTLDRFGGNRTQAARALGISVRTLQRKLKRWQAGMLTAPPAG